MIRPDTEHGKTFQASSAADVGKCNGMVAPRKIADRQFTLCLPPTATRIVFSHCAVYKLDVADGLESSPSTTQKHKAWLYPGVQVRNCCVTHMSRSSSADARAFSVQSVREEERAHEENGCCVCAELSRIFCLHTMPCSQFCCLFLPVQISHGACRLSLSQHKPLPSAGWVDIS